MEACLHLFSTSVVICFTLQKEGGDLASELKKKISLSLSLFRYCEKHEFPGLAVKFFMECFLNIPITLR